MVIAGEDLLTDASGPFPLIHAVGRASVRPPRLVDLIWGNPAHPKVTLVGKGVVFDTGGLDIKPPSNMIGVLMRLRTGTRATADSTSDLAVHTTVQTATPPANPQTRNLQQFFPPLRPLPAPTPPLQSQIPRHPLCYPGMKKDMGGAGAVLSLAHMIMAAGVPVRLRVLIPAVENSIDGNAFRPSDVIKSRKARSPLRESADGGAGALQLQLRLWPWMWIPAAAFCRPATPRHATNALGPGFRCVTPIRRALRELSRAAMHCRWSLGVTLITISCESHRGSPWRSATQTQRGA